MPGKGAVRVIHFLVPVVPDAVDICEHCDFTFPYREYDRHGEYPHWHCMASKRRLPVLTTVCDLLCAPYGPLSEIT